MLTHLLIENFVIVERLEIAFQDGLCLLTGETGAGKSLVIAALNAVTGGRVSLDQVRQGAGQAYLEATFAPPPDSPVWALLVAQGFEREETVALSRSIGARGSRCRINGEHVTQAVLGQIGALLVDVLGQHEHVSLMKSERHLALLDGLGDRAHQADLAKLAEGHALWKQAQTRLVELRQAQIERERQVDFWRFQLAEIDEAQLQPGEDEQLRIERDLLANATHLQEGLGGVAAVLTGDEGILTGLQQAVSQLRSAVRHADSLQPLLDQLIEAQTLIEDSGREIRQQVEQLDANPARLDEVAERLDLLTKLKRKYGETVEDVLAFAEETGRELAKAETAFDEIAELESAVQLGEGELLKLAGKVSEQRRQLARALETAVTTELADLGMGGCGFQVALQAKALGETGLDGAEFLIAPNVGEPFRPLGRIASGGEMSRLMLALKIVLRQTDPIPTLVFDEVDTGISGGAARVVAEKLGQLARDFQVLCITHLPTVAAMADQHLRLQKRAEGQSTAVQAVDLAHRERMEELAYMATGTRSEIAIKQAVDLYKQAEAFKKKGRG